MAIGTISAGESGLSVRTKLNQAIGKANEVDGKASADALASEASTRAQADAAETDARQEAIAGEAAARQQEMAQETASRVAGDNARITYAEAAAEHARPGEAHRMFTGDTDGAPEAVDPLDDDAKAVTSDGAVAVIDGAGIVAPLSAFRVEPGRQYRVRYVVRRATDTEDPANDAIRLALRWLKADKSGQATTILADLVDIFAENGRLEYLFNFARQEADNIDAAAPPAAVYVRPFVRAFGSGVTHVEVVEVTDLSDAIDFAPDVSGFVRQLAGYDHRLESFTARVDVAETQIEASHDAGWFTRGTLDDARLSEHVPFTDADETITGDYTFAAAATMLGPMYFGLAEGGGPAARIIADGNFFAMAPTDLAGGFNTLREFHFNPDGDGVWTAEGGFKTTGNLLVVGAGSFTDAAGTRTNLEVYSTDEVDAALADEAATRAAADAVLQGNIDAEATTRAAADAVLQGSIDAETADRTAADTLLQGNIDAEEAARNSADTQLQGNIDAEASARASADTVINDALAAEVGSRTSADTTLQTAIDDEADARAAADSALQGDIDLKAPLADPTFTGTVTLPATVIGAFPIFDDDAAAGTGGLTAGQLYATATGELRIKL